MSNSAFDNIPSCTLNLIPRETVSAVVDMITPKLSEIVTRSRGRWTLPGVLERFADGRWQLWIIWRGEIAAVLATQVFQEMDGSRTCGILFVTGDDSLQWLHLLDILESWSRAQGCVRIEGAMRRGWARRLSDYRLTHVVLEKELV